MKKHYYMIVRQDLIYNKKILKEGLNTFDGFCKSSYDKKGFFLLTGETLLYYLECGSKIIEVEIPEDEEIIVLKSGYKASRIIIDDLDNIKDLYTLSTIHWFKRESINIDTYKYDYFLNLCKHGSLYAAKYFYETNNLNIHYNNEFIFRKLCCFHKLETLKWIYNLGNIDIYANNNEAFRHACEYDILEVAQWLYNMGGINIYEKNNYVFKWSLYEGSLETLRWLVDIEKNIFDELNLIELKKWMYSQKFINKHEDKNLAFREKTMNCLAFLQNEIDKRKEESKGSLFLLIDSVYTPLFSLESICKLFLIKSLSIEKNAVKSQIT